jgi:hypothetical protein
MRCLLAAALILAPLSIAAQEADLVLTGGRFWTGDPARPYARRWRFVMASC